MKIGIVSPFNDSEANSGYSLALEKEFICQGHRVKRYELPLSLISDASPSTSSPARPFRHFRPAEDELK